MYTQSLWFNDQNETFLLKIIQLTVIWSIVLSARIYIFFVICTNFFLFIFRKSNISIHIYIFFFGVDFKLATLKVYVEVSWFSAIVFLFMLYLCMYVDNRINLSESESTPLVTNKIYL